MIRYSQGVLATCSVVLMAALFSAPVWAQDRYSDVVPGTPPVSPSASGPPPAPLAMLTFYTDRATFEAAFPGVLTLENFAGTSVTPGNVGSCSPPLNNTTSDACFPAGIVPGIELDVVVDGGGGLYAVLGVGFLGVTNVAVGPNSFVDHSVWRFSGATNLFGATLVCPNGTATLDIEFFDTGGSSLGTTTATCGGPPGNFFGVSSDMELSRIEFVSVGGEGELFDNVLFGFVAPVPTLGSWRLALLALVLATASMLALRRRQAA